jgi:enoyl-CoA hydratase/carnithine racemase
MDYLVVKHEGPLTRIVLDRAERRNALSLALMEELIAALTDLPAETQVVVIGAEGPAFSAGHDLSEMVDRDPEFYDQLFEVCTVLMETIQRIPQPVIARVQGIATAAGCQLVAACDLAVASDRATFATPGVKIGLFCSTPMVPLSRAIGRKRALEMLLTGKPIDAVTALEWGLVNRVVPEDSLDAAVDEFVYQIARFSPSVIGLGKLAFYRQVGMDDPDAYGLTKKVMASNARLADAHEGITAFLEKRDPIWPR